MNPLIRTIRSLLVVAGVLAAAVVSGCTGRYENDFPVLVINRTANQIQALANGNAIGEVAAGQTGSFTLNLPESNKNVFVNGTAPTPQAEVTLTAKDTRTGMLSSEKSVVLTHGNPTTVSFTADDFPSTGPTIARFTFSPTNPTINQDVSFNASSSTVSNGTFAWDFGDGQTGTGVTLTHRYVRNGTFTVTLTATSDTRASSSSSRTINVSATLPATVANFTFSPTQPSINQDVSFTANASPVIGGPGGGFPGGPGVTPFGATYSWDFGDGTSGTGTSTTHRYTRGGTYTVRLVVTSDTGLSATTTRQITVSTTLPAGSANFVFSPTDPHTGDTVFFNASSSTITDVSSYSWDFGDGSTASGVNPTHVYTNERTFTVSLTVTNSRGQVASVSKTVTVNNGD
jgi:PKD repeat protein